MTMCQDSREHIWPRAPRTSAVLLRNFITITRTSLLLTRGTRKHETLCGGEGSTIQGGSGVSSNAAEQCGRGFGVDRMIWSVDWNNRRARSELLVEVEGASEGVGLRVGRLKYLPKFVRLLV